LIFKKVDSYETYLKDHHPDRCRQRHGPRTDLSTPEKGANVAGVDIHATTLEETRQLAGVGEDQFRGFVLDIADRAKVDVFPEKVLRHFGSVDGIINNAGIIQPFKPVPRKQSQQTTSYP
jgi:NAD(P)-dependent dehydrogenase (short-subunit alcohol dehydrogenase family)